MALSAFDDRSQVPEPQKLVEVLVPADGLWGELTSTVRSRFDPLTEDWGFSGKKWGWALRLKHKKRAILYMTPCHGYFVVGFALGQKAVDAANDSDLPQPVLDLIDDSHKYAEGRAVRFEVRCNEDLVNVLRIADIKMAS